MTLIKNTDVTFARAVLQWACLSKKASSLSAAMIFLRGFPNDSALHYADSDPSVWHNLITSYFKVSWAETIDLVLFCKMKILEFVFSEVPKFYERNQEIILKWLLIKHSWGILHLLWQQRGVSLQYVLCFLLNLWKNLKPMVLLRYQMFRFLFQINFIFNLFVIF